MFHSFGGFTKRLVLLNWKGFIYETNSWKILSNTHRHKFQGIDFNKRIICKIFHGCKMDDLAELFILYLSYRFIGNAIIWIIYNRFFPKQLCHVYTIKICLHELTRQVNTGIFPGTFCVNCKRAQLKFNDISHIFHYMLSRQVVTDLRISYTETSSLHIHKIYIHSLRSLVDHYDYDNFGPSAFRSSQNMGHT